MGPLRREILSDADRLRGGGGSHGDAGLLEGHVPARILADYLLGRVGHIRAVLGSADGHIVLDLSLLPRLIDY